MSYLYPYLVKTYPQWVYPWGMNREPEGKVPEAAEGVGVWWDIQDMVERSRMRRDR